MLGGCCGTDDRHVAQICSAWRRRPRLAQSTSRRLTAQRLSSCRFESWSLRSTELTCASTVFTEMLRRSRDLLVEVAAGDVAEHLALAGCELVELGIDLLGGEVARRTRRARSRRAWGRRRRPRPGLAARRRRALAGDRLGDVATGAGADDRDHVLRVVGHRERQEPLLRTLPSRPARSPRPRRRPACGRRAGRHRARAR